MVSISSLKYIKAVIKYVKTSQLSREEMLQVQEKNWRRMVAYAQKKSPYYARIMKEKGLDARTARPEDFPVLNKKIIQDHFDEIVTDRRIRLEDVHAHVQKGDPSAKYLGKYLVIKTSGSTGKPGYFLFDKNEMIAGIAVSIGRSPIVGHKDRRRMALLGFARSFASSSQSVQFGNDLLISKLMVDFKIISIEQPFAEVVREINEYKPNIVSGYAKLLLLLADAKRRGDLKIAPDVLHSGGESLLDSDSRYLREIFQCPVHNHYGCTEAFAMGISADGQNSMELFEDHVHFRIEGENTYITNLHSWTLPLINYHMRDLLVPRPLIEAKPFLRVESTIGRSDEIPYFTTEKEGRVTVHPMAFDPIMPEGVKSFFMSCSRSNHVIFHIFVDEKFEANKEQIFADIRQRLKEFFSDKKLPQLQFDVVHETDYGINNKTGKTQFWRNNLS